MGAALEAFFAEMDAVRRDYEDAKQKALARAEAAHDKLAQSIATGRQALAAADAEALRVAASKPEGPG